MKIRVNPRRLVSLLQRLEQGCYEGVYRAPGGWIIIFDKAVIHVRDTGEVRADGMMPAVQSFLSRVPLSPVPDSQQSDADDSDTAAQQSGCNDPRCEDDRTSSAQRSSSPAVGSKMRLSDGASSVSGEADSSEANGHAQADSESSSEDSEPQPGSSPDAGASGQGESVQAEQNGAAKAPSPDAPGDEEGTEGHAQGKPASSLPGGEVSSFSVVRGATKNKAPRQNPFRISLRARQDHGGVFARLSDPKSQPSRNLVHRARAVFARMLHGGEGSPGARWCASRVAMKTAGYLRSMTIADRRDEDGRPAILILSDVSGSMVTCARDVLQFALAVSRIGLHGGEIVAVAQSNGYPDEVLQYRRVSRVTSLGVYQQIISRHDVRAVVIAADHDGEDIYHTLYENTTARYYWLHAYASAQAERVKIVRPGHDLWPDWATPYRLRMAYGCGTAERALEAMERLIAAP